MIGKNSSRRVESSLKRTRFMGHLGLMVGVFRELEVDKLIDEKLSKERDHNIPHSVCILAMVLRNDETIISSISVTDIFFDVYLGKWNYRAIPKVKTWSYFLTIPK